MENDAEPDWRARWVNGREYAVRAAIEWATALVAAGTPPILVSEALAAASEAVRCGVDATAAEVLGTLRTEQRTE